MLDGVALALMEPDENLSAYPDPIVQPRDKFRGTTKRTGEVPAGPIDPASEQLACPGALRQQQFQIFHGQILQHTSGIVPGQNCIGQ